MAWVKNSDIRDGVVTSGKLGALAITAAKLALSIVGGSHMVAGALVITTAAGAAAGDVTVTGIATADKLICVLRLDRDATAANINLSTLTSEFTITAAATINNAAGTNTTGDTLVVAYWDVSAV
jgi:hypothetical protein